LAAQIERLFPDACCCDRNRSIVGVPRMCFAVVIGHSLDHR